MAHALNNVLDAAALVRDRQDIQFLFVGAGAERNALIERAHQEGLSNVVFLEAQPKERMPDVWSLCDVALVHLKSSEVFAGVIPSKIFEAMRYEAANFVCRAERRRQPHCVRCKGRLSCERRRRQGPC